MRYDIKNHSSAIYQVASTRSEGRGAIFLNFADEDHYRCISEMFGGEDYFKNEFPNHYLLAQKTRQYHAENQAVIAESSQQGFIDHTEVLDVSYKKSDKMLYSCAYTNLTGEADELCQLLLVRRNNEVISHNFDFVIGKGYAYIDLTTENIEPLGGRNDNITIIIQSTWKPKGKDTLLSVINYESRDSLDITLGEDVVKKIDVTDPIKKIKPEKKGPIKVAYGRKADDLDYSYVFDFTTGPNVFIENSGNVTLRDDVTFVKGNVKKTKIILSAILNPSATRKEESFGDVFYFNNIPENAIKRVDDTHFTWNIDKNWNNTIKTTSRTGLADYAYIMQIAFFAKIKGYEEPIECFIKISSYPQKLSNPHFIQIPYINIWWGCLAEDTLVRMADGSTKTIQTIGVGDRVMGPGGKSRNVTNVWTGTEKELLCIIMKNGKEIMATEMHPFLTREGMKPILNLSICDELLMEDGDYSAIAQCYPVSWVRNVYNLDVDGDGAFICNGFVVGDNTIQNSCQVPANEVPTQPTLLIEAEKLRSIYSRIK